jgi:hypothetical protein
VANADGDPMMTAGADVILRGFVRLHPTHLHGTESAIPQPHHYPSIAHANNPMTAIAAAKMNT